jgi:DNA-binding NarL/FixJ family response regulator
MNYVNGQLIKVAVADDHDLLRKALSKLVNSSDHFKIVIEAENGEKLIQALRALPETALPNVILLDVNMPVMNGVETAKVLKTDFPAIKVLVLSMFSDANTVVTMLRSGISGYLTKNVEPEELFTAIEEVYRGGRYFSPPVTIVAMTYLSITPDGSSKNLSQKEMDIVKLIFQEKTSDEIAKTLIISKRTVDTMIANIMEKLQVNSRVGIVLAALKTNIVNLQGEALP